MREKLKSLALFLLCLLLFVNLFFYTSYLQPEETRPEPREITAESLASLIGPASVSYKDERGRHYKAALGQEERGAASRILRESLNQLMIGPHSILDEHYEALYQKNSVSFYMNLSLDIKALISLVIDKPDNTGLQNLKIKGQLQELIIPMDLKTLVFKINGICYEVPLLSELRADVEQVKSSVITSSSVTYAYGKVLGQAEPVLLPVAGYLAPPVYSIHTKSDFSEGELDRMSRRIFGAGSDFLKGALTGDGSLFLVYGYGDEILSIDRKGFIQYKNNQNLNYKPDTLRSALSSALSFILRLNGEDHPYRLGALLYSEAQDVYKFYFSALSLELPVRFEKEDYDIIVEVKSGQVLNYKQIYYDMAVEEGNKHRQGIDFASNYLEMMLKDEKLRPEVEALGELKELGISYLRLENEVSPVIVIQGEKGELALDYYTGVIR